MKWLKKTLKIIAYIFFTLVFFIGGFYAKAYLSVEKRINKKYPVDVEKLDITYDSVILAEGERLTSIKGCRDCHDRDLGGKNFINDPMVGVLDAPNLTKGEGGLPANFDTDDWVRVLKHGVRQDSTAVWVMPSHKFAKLTEGDMSAIIAYCSRLPKIDRSFPTPELGPLGRVLTDLGKINLFPAEHIDHSAPLVREIKPEVSLGYGKYLAQSCNGCHREHLKGGDALAKGSPPVPDISSTGRPGKWSDEQFMATLRTGKTPEGKNLDERYMPWPATKSFTDVELKALHLYLRSM
jgi:hypothetical protein